MMCILGPIVPYHVNRAEGEIVSNGHVPSIKTCCSQMSLLDGALIIQALLVRMSNFAGPQVGSLTQELELAHAVILSQDDCARRMSERYQETDSRLSELQCDHG
jgi:hypothetical protein